MNENRTARTDPEDVDEAQAAVERNRERLSDTLDAIEHRLVETKAAIRERVNVLRPVQKQVRSRPWLAVAAAAGAGAALGALLGRDKDSIIDETERRRRRAWRARRRARVHGGDTQARDGLRIAAEQPRRGKRRKGRQKDAGMSGVRNELMRTIASAITAGLKERAIHGSGRRDSGAAREVERNSARGNEGGQARRSARHGAETR